MTSVELYLDALHHIEEDIESSGYKNGFYARRICPSCSTAIYVRKRQPDGQQGLAFEVIPSVVKPLTLRHVSQGLVVSTEMDVNAEGKRICRVSITLGASAFKELFVELAGHLLDHILSATTEKEAMENLQSQLLLWRKFLDRNADEGLSSEQQCGLFGELSFIKLCIENRIPALAVLNAWTGPIGENQDFSFGSRSIEVKATVSNDASRIHISNPRQLDDAGLSALYLYHYALDRRPAFGKTLPQLIEWLTEAIAIEDSSLVVIFDERLMAAGYLRSHHALYSEIGYLVRYENGYVVDERFPRVLESDLPPGVSNMKYVVELACVNHLGIDANHIITELENRVNEET